MTVGPTPIARRRARRPLGLTGVVAVVLLIGGIAVVLLVQRGVFKGSSGSKALLGSGIAARETRDVSRFSAIDLAGSNTVTIRAGSKQSVVVSADDNLLRRVTTRVKAETLVIGTTGTFTAKSPMSVKITVPSLATLRLSGSGSVTASHIREARLTIGLSGSGVVRASGTATRLDVALDGSGEAQLARLVARNARAVISGSGRILVTATATLDAAVPGSGSIAYGGNPAHVTRRVTGSGSITPSS